MRPDAIVIGAGFGGLSAATALAGQGARVLVLEARPTLGGRASAARDPATGEKLDNGQHVLMGCYDETLAFLRRIGTIDRIRRQAGLAVPIIDREGRRSTLALPPLPAPLHLLAGVVAWEALGWRDRLSVLAAGASLLGQGSPSTAAVTETVGEWLRRQGQSPRLIELFWEPLALAALNQPIEVAAVDTFLEVVARMFGPSADRASLVLPAVPLDELYAEPARRWLEARGSAVRARSPAGIRVRGDRVVGVTVRDEAIEAPVVIASVAWSSLPALFEEPPAALEDLLTRARLTAGFPIVTVNLWYDRPVLDEMLVGLPGRVFQWVFDKGRVFGRARSHLSLVSSGAAAIVAKTNDELIRLARREVEASLPSAAEARLLGASAVRERNATFSLAPGQPARPGSRTAVDGLFLAGDWVQTGLPATIESAVIAGHLAAELALH